MKMQTFKQQYLRDGYVVVDNVFTGYEVGKMLSEIEVGQALNNNFRRSDDLFAIRQFLKEFSELKQCVFNKALKNIVMELFGSDFFLTKSLYFDKPPLSNWFVAYHQDLTISVEGKAEIDGFGPWTKKQNQYAVQPPLAILQNSFTIRIHLDDTNKYNGALKVIPGSHHKGIYRPETIDWLKETEAICDAKVGSVMIMSPLLLHASDRTIVNKRRRVIHLEFGNMELPKPLQWSERMELFPELLALPKA